MVAIVSGNSTGLNLTSLANSGQRGNLGTAGQGKTGEQSYVNVANGNLVVLDQDTFVSSRGNDISVLRTYNSQGKLSDDNGDAWWINGYRRIINQTGTINQPGSTIQRIGADNSLETYDFDATSQTYIAHAGSGKFDTLAYDSGTATWTWTNPSTQNKESYTAHADTWRLATASDANGNTTSYSYNGDLLSKITSANGETVEFIYTGNNLSQERIVAADGKVTSNTRYSYDAQNRLSQVQLDLSPEDACIADGKVYSTSYTYVGASKLIDSITQTDGSVQKFTYITVDGESRVASISDADNNTTRFDYDTINRQTKVTDAFGNVSVYTLTTDKRFDSVTAPAANGQTATVRYTYDGAGNIASLTDAQNNITSFVYDTAGNLLSKTDAQGNRVDNTYNSNNDLVSSSLTPAAGSNQATGVQTTRYLYDEHHNLRFQISAAGNVTEQRYDSAGQKTAEIHYTSASYPVAGLAASAAPTLDQLQSWGTAQTQSNTTRSDYGYNTRGQLTSVTTYAKLGADGTGIKDGTESKTQYAYDVAGNLLLTIDGQNNQTSYTYDGMGRVLSTTDALQKTGYTEYDDANHKIVQHKASGRVDTHVFDNQGHLLSSSLGGELTTSYGYDVLGRLVYAKDPTGVEQLHIYDEAGNVQADINGKGEVTQYIYNVLGQKVQAIARANALTDTQFQQLKAQVVQTGSNTPAPANVSNIPVTASASDMIVRTLYDKLGRIAKTISPLGEVTELQYNAAGKLVATIQRANTLNPSSVGVNATAEDINVSTDASKDRSSYRYYDQDQRLIGTADAEGGLVEYRYDSAGRQTTTIAYATQNKNAQVDSAFSSLITQNPSSDAISYNFYDPENQLVGTVNAEGYATEYQYNLNGQVSQTTRYSNKISNVSSNATWEALRPVANATQDLVTKQTYDVLGRAKVNTAANGSITTSFYDNNTGQLIQQKLNLGTAQSRFANLKYDQYGRVIGDMSSIGGWQLNTGSISETTAWQNYGVSYTYDNANRRTSSTDQNGHRTLYYYDQAGHLTHTINALGEVTENRYNHLGQLTDTIRYGTRLTGVASLTGGLITSSLTQSLTAIADSKLDSVQQLNYDLDGRVASMTDANGNVTTYRYDQFGERIGTTSPVTDIDNVESTTSYNKLGQVTDTVQDANGIKQTKHIDYDAFGRAIRAVDANGNVKTQIFDRLGRTIEVNDQISGHSNKTTYNAFDQVLTLTDAKGNVSTVAYTNGSLRTDAKQTSAEGNTVVTTVNSYGQVISSTDGKGNISSLSYDRDGNLKFRTSSDGVNNFTESSIYDNADLLKESTDANGNKTTYAYDDANRLISKTLIIAGSAPLVTTYVYDAKGQQVEITDPNNVKTKLEYDLKGQLIKQTVDPDGLKLVTEYSYDKRGKTLKVTQKGETQDLVQRYVFDKLGRRIEEYTGTTLTRSYQYDANNNVISSTDALNNVTRFAYDSENRQTLFVDAAGDVQRTTYDENGHIKSVRRYATTIALNGLSTQPTRAMLEALVPADSAQDQFTTNNYDKDGRLTSTVDALGSVVSYVYDASNNVVKKTSGDGVNPANDRTQWFAYDGMNRLTVSIAADGSVISKSYDGNSNVISTTAYANRISTANLAVGAKPQDYLSQVQTSAQLDRTERRAYDAANRLVYVVDAESYVRQNIYEGLHLKQTVQYANAVNVSNSDAASIKAAINADASKDRMFSYTYDHAGHVLTATDALGNTESYTYNSLGQKTSYTNKLKATWTYTYDEAGRLASETSPAIALASVTIDANGNLQSDTTVQAGIVTRMTYDGQGNLRSRTEAVGRPEQRVTQYEYDALGRLTKTIYPPTAIYNAAADNLAGNGATGLATRTESNVTLTSELRYDSFGHVVANRDTAGNTSYRSYDQVGRISYTVDALGNTTGYTYNSFGDTSTETRYAHAVNISSMLNAGATTQQAPQTSQISAALAGMDHQQDRTTTTKYDLLGRPVEITGPATWINNGLPGSASVQANSVTRYSYDAFGSLSQTSVLADPQSNNWNTSRYFYDKDGRRTAAINALGYVSTQSYDAAGNIVRTTEYATALSATDSQASNLVLPAVSGDDRSIVYGYDKANRQTSETRLNVSYNDGSENLATGQRSHADLTTSKEYDATGNLIATTDALGNRSYRYYDALGRIRAVAQAAVSTASGTTLRPLTEYQRDALGNVVTKAEYANGAAATDSLGYTKGSTSSDDRISLARYDSNNNVVQNTDANGVNHFASYDAQNHLRKNWMGVSGNDGVVHTLFTAYEYDALGRRTASITPASTSQLSSDGSKIITVAQAVAGVVRKEASYNAFGDVISEGTNGQQTYHYDYDNAGRLWRSNGGDGVTRVMQYDLQGHQTATYSTTGGNRISLQLGNGDPLTTIQNSQQADQLQGMRRTLNQYDLLGRVTTIIETTRDGQTPVIHQSFDRWGNLTSRSDLNGFNGVTTYQYNANNQLIEQRTPDATGQQTADSAVSRLYYDQLGRQIARTDAVGNTNRQSWDANGQLRTETHADGGIVVHNYNGLGQQSSQTDANGNTSRYQYDHLGHLLTTSTDLVVKSSTSNGILTSNQQSLVSSTSYDQAGRVLSSTNGNGETTLYDVDLRGNTVRSQQAMGQVRQTAYDSQGHQTASQDANGAISTWRYNSTGQLQSHTDIGGAVTSYAYDNAGQLQQQTSTRGQNLNYHYDDAGQVTQIRDLALDKTTLYSYNLAGQHVREQTIQADYSLQDNQLSYNALGQLARVDDQSGYAIAFDYDKNGNLLHQHQTQQTEAASTTTRNVSISGTQHTIKHEQAALAAATKDNWYAYDGMQRQTLVEGSTNATAADNTNVNASQGRQLTYDKNGNVASDTAWGKELVAQIPLGTDGQPDTSHTTYVIREGLITRYFSYDAANRLTSIAVASYDTTGKRLAASYATVVDQRYYDGNGRLVQQGINNSMAPGYLQALQSSQLASAAEIAVNNQKAYNANGDLLSETVRNAQSQLSLQTDYTQYDNEGHLQAYTSHDNAGNSLQVQLQQIKADAYLQGSVLTTKTNAKWASLGGQSNRQYNYDVNGNLIELNVTDSNQSGSRLTVTHENHDASGKIIQSEQAGVVTNNLLINRQIFHSSLGTTSNNFASNKGNGTGKSEPWQSGTSATQALVNNLRMAELQASSSNSAPPPAAPVAAPAPAPTAAGGSTGTASTSTKSTLASNAVTATSSSGSSGATTATTGDPYINSLLQLHQHESALNLAPGKIQVVLYKADADLVPLAYKPDLSDELKTQIAEAGTQFDTLTGQVKTLRDQVTKLLADTNAIEKTWKPTAPDAMAKIAAAQAQIDALKAKVDALQDPADQFKTHVADLKKKVEDYEKEHQPTDQDIADSNTFDQITDDGVDKNSGDDGKVVAKVNGYQDTLNLGNTKTADSANTALKDIATTGSQDAGTTGSGNSNGGNITDNHVTADGETHTGGTTGDAAGSSKPGDSVNTDTSNTSMNLDTTTKDTTGSGSGNSNVSVVDNSADNSALLHQVNVALDSDYYNQVTDTGTGRKWTEEEVNKFVQNLKDNYIPGSSPSDSSFDDYAYNKKFESALLAAQGLDGGNQDVQLSRGAAGTGGIPLTPAQKAEIRDARAAGDLPLLNNSYDTRPGALVLRGGKYLWDGLNNAYDDARKSLMEFVGETPKPGDSILANPISDHKPINVLITPIPESSDKSSGMLIYPSNSEYKSPFIYTPIPEVGILNPIFTPILPPQGPSIMMQENSGKTVGNYATDLPTVQQGTRSWDQAVDDMRNLEKGKINIRTETASDAKALLFEARGEMDRRKEYATGEVKYYKGYEVHNDQNQRELDVGNNLQHLKWKDGKSGGHIFYNKPN